MQVAPGKASRRPRPGSAARRLVPIHGRGRQGPADDPFHFFPELSRSHSTTHVRHSPRSVFEKLSSPSWSRHLWMSARDRETAAVSTARIDAAGADSLMSCFIAPSLLSFAVILPYPEGRRTMGRPCRVSSLFSQQFQRDRAFSRRGRRRRLSSGPLRKACPGQYLVRITASGGEGPGRPPLS